MKRRLSLLASQLLLIGGVLAQPPTAQQVRQSIAQDIDQLKTPSSPVGSVRDAVVRTRTDSIPIRIYRPADAPANRPTPIIYHIHGGAWVAGDLETHDKICRRLCHDAQAVVVAVQYRRPPEYPYPAGNDDILAVLNWIQAKRSTLSQKGPLILLGDSAGGDLAAATCLRNATAARPVPIAAQLLINPALDVRPGSPTFKAYELVIRWGLPDLAKASDPFVSPLAATDQQLKALPPTSIVVSEQDEIREDGVQLHRRLQAVGVKTALFEQEKIGHLGAVWAADHPVIKPALTFVLQQIAAIRTSP
ncbi:Alpha/beta hydrolase fold-3 domain protein [Fibrella aestuarina BUZ 2]|uniref:Alpha/beta hydrolase fold-3 domain protein n=1 Tax=Fibrella aestuarina BUZ 2 TaxID=1166018 RepID=I0KCL0_9BACT|nr:alpha/beta hydrolase [Fibrella aestuarina]CCH01863.1 Alpha/beta hydrolase fold-3 domain protein [Fibrella aestuarina BUZ 2]